MKKTTQILSVLKEGIKIQREKFHNMPGYSKTEDWTDEDTKKEFQRGIIEGFAIAINLIEAIENPIKYKVSECGNAWLPIK